MYAGDVLNENREMEHCILSITLTVMTSCKLGKFYM